MSWNRRVGTLFVPTAFLICHNSAGSDSHI